MPSNSQYESKLTKFDPNTSKLVDKKEPSEWGTYVPERSPQWKYHPDETMGIRSVKYYMTNGKEAQLFKKTDDKWTLHTSVFKADLCAVCKESVITNMFCYGNHQHLNWGNLVPGHPAPAHLVPRVCVDCATRRFSMYGRRATKPVNPYDIPDINGDFYDAPGKKKAKEAPVAAAAK